jgi:hypothetical protein
MVKEFAMSDEEIDANTLMERVRELVAYVHGLGEEEWEIASSHTGKMTKERAVAEVEKVIVENVMGEVLNGVMSAGSDG